MLHSQGLHHTSHIAFKALFVLIIFSIAACGRPTSPTASDTEIPPLTSTVIPSPTPPLIDPSQFPAAAQVWGKPTLKMTMPANFTFESLSDDGTKAFGYETTSDGLTYQAGWVSLTNGAFTLVESAPIKNPNNPMNDNYRPECCMTDGRYLVGTNNTDAKADNSLLWYYDTQTNRVTTTQFGQLLWVKNGIAIYGTTDNSGATTIMQINLATGQEQKASFSVPANLNLYVFPLYSNYPYIIYGNGSEHHLLDTLTGQDTNITSYPGNPDGGLIVGNNLFYSDGGIYDANIQTGQRTTLVSYSLPSTVTGDGLVGTNERVLSFSFQSESNNGSWLYAAVWDLILHKWILIIPPILNPPANLQLALSSHFLAVVDGSHNFTLYDTSTLPNS